MVGSKIYVYYLHYVAIYQFITQQRTKNSVIDYKTIENILFVWNFIGHILQGCKSIFCWERNSFICEIQGDILLKVKHKKFYYVKPEFRFLNKACHKMTSATINDITLKVMTAVKVKILLTSSELEKFKVRRSLKR